MKFGIGTICSTFLALCFVACAQPDGANRRTAQPLQVALIGGGTHHDFEKWFNQEDVKTLTIQGRVKPTYTGDAKEIANVAKNADVLVLSLNHAIPQEAKDAIMAHANAGKGLVLLHAGLWYNWKDWPDYNKQLIGGGSRSHDKFQEFEVSVTNTEHPIMAGVPQNFKITDELYHHNTDTSGAKATVLATGKSPTNEKVHPVIWIAQHPKARIACITLGHDGKAHQLDAFKTLLVNSVKWAGEKK